jgi:acetyl-CoA carboxylase carboxyl transferase subunit alpha
VDAETGAAWRRVELARHPERPYALDYIRRWTTGFHELHGDRLTGDDPALVAGLATWHGQTVMFFGQQKGRSFRDRLARNYGMMHPEGYRKAMRLAAMAARFGFPIISLVDTPGAFPGAHAEERGIASAIASAIMDWFRVRTPVVAAIIGEGGSGGSLGMAVADRVVVMENAIYSVASPEACASILWRDAARKQTAAGQLRLVPEELLAMGIMDEIVPEPPGGAHAHHDEAARLLDETLHRHVLALQRHDLDTLLLRRRERFRSMGLGASSPVAR